MSSCDLRDLSPSLLAHMVNARYIPSRDQLDEAAGAEPGRVSNYSGKIHSRERRRVIKGKR